MGDILNKKTSRILPITLVFLILSAPIGIGTNISDYNYESYSSEIIKNNN